MPAAPPILGSTGSTTLLLAGALVVLGVAMICTTVWLVRATRSDVPALGPLEVMGDRRFRRRDDEARQHVLAAARPPGALAPAPMLDAGIDIDVAAEAPPAPAPAAAQPRPAAAAEPAEVEEPVATAAEPLPAESA